MSDKIKKVSLIKTTPTTNRFTNIVKQQPTEPTKDLKSKALEEIGNTGNRFINLVNMGAGLLGTGILQAGSKIGEALGGKPLYTPEEFKSSYKRAVTSPITGGEGALSFSKTVEDKKLPGWAKVPAFALDVVADPLLLASLGASKAIGTAGKALEAVKTAEGLAEATQQLSKANRFSKLISGTEKVGTIGLGARAVSDIAQGNVGQGLVEGGFALLGARGIRADKENRAIANEYGRYIAESAGDNNRFVNKLKSLSEFTAEKVNKVKSPTADLKLTDEISAISRPQQNIDYFARQAKKALVDSKLPEEEKARLLESLPKDEYLADAYSTIVKEKGSVEPVRQLDAMRGRLINNLKEVPEEELKKDITNYLVSKKWLQGLGEQKVLNPKIITSEDAISETDAINKISELGARYGKEFTDYLDNLLERSKILNDKSINVQAIDAEANNPILPLWTKKETSNIRSTGLKENDWIKTYRPNTYEYKYSDYISPDLALADAIKKAERQSQINEFITGYLKPYVEVADRLGGKAGKIVDTSEMIVNRKNAIQSVYNEKAILDNLLNNYKSTSKEATKISNEIASLDNKLKEIMAEYPYLENALIKGDSTYLSKTKPWTGGRSVQSLGNTFKDLSIDFDFKSLPIDEIKQKYGTTANPNISIPTSKNIKQDLKEFKSLKLNTPFKDYLINKYGDLSIYLKERGYSKDIDTLVNNIKKGITTSSSSGGGNLVPKEATLKEWLKQNTKISDIRRALNDLNEVSKPTLEDKAVLENMIKQTRENIDTQRNIIRNNSKKSFDESTMKVLPTYNKQTGIWEEIAIPNKVHKDIAGELEAKTARGVGSNLMDLATATVSTFAINTNPAYFIKQLFLAPIAQQASKFPIPLREYWRPKRLANIVMQYVNSSDANWIRDLKYSLLENKDYSKLGASLRKTSLGDAMVKELQGIHAFEKEFGTSGSFQQKSIEEADKAIVEASTHVGEVLNGLNQLFTKVSADLHKTGRVLQAVDTSTKQLAYEYYKKQGMYDKIPKSVLDFEIANYQAQNNTAYLAGSNVPALKNLLFIKSIITGNLRQIERVIKQPKTLTKYAVLAGAVLSLKNLDKTYDAKQQQLIAEDRAGSYETNKFLDIPLPALFNSKTEELDVNGNPTGKMKEVPTYITIPMAEVNQEIQSFANYISNDIVESTKYTKSTPTSGFDQVITRLNPAISTPIQLATGREAYTGRPIKNKTEFLLKSMAIPTTERTIENRYNPLAVVRKEGLAGGKDYSSQESIDKYNEIVAKNTEDRKLQATIDMEALKADKTSAVKEIYLRNKGTQKPGVTKTYIKNLLKKIATRQRVTIEIADLGGSTKDKVEAIMLGGEDIIARNLERAKENKDKVLIVALKRAIKLQETQKSPNQ